MLAFSLLCAAFDVVVQAPVLGEVGERKAAWQDRALQLLGLEDG